MASFRVASTSRRYDKDNGRWVDGPSLRVRVTCWRRLAEGVTKSVVTGDPLVVTGRMYTRDWVGDDGQHRVSYELEAIAIGHDLSRGFAEFRRHRPAGATTVVEDAEAEARIAGEVSVPVPTFGPPPMTDAYGDFDPAGTGPEDAEAAEEDAMKVLRAAGLGGSAEPGSSAQARSDEPGSSAQARSDEPGSSAEASTAEASSSEPADTISDLAASEDGEPARPGARRGRVRVPVPA